MSEKNDSCPCGPGAFHTPREVLDFVMANPPMIDRAKDGHIGVKRSRSCMMAWCFQEGAAVVAYAVRCLKDGKYIDAWNYTVMVDCRRVVTGCVYGGTTYANQVLKKLRNGIVSARLKKLHNRKNRRARANGGVEHE